MRTFYRTFTRLTAAALIVAMSAAPGLAAKTTPATDKNTNVPAVPRAIPDLVPYHNFDPPKGVFDPSRLTISGDTVLAVSGLSWGVGGLTILSGIDLTVAPGEFLSVMTPLAIVLLAVDAIDKRLARR